MHKKRKVNKGQKSDSKPQNPKPQHLSLLSEWLFEEIVWPTAAHLGDILSIYYTVTGGTNQLKPECLPWQFTCIVVNFCTAAKLLWRARRFVCFYKYAGLSGYTKQWLWCAMCDIFNLWSLIEKRWVYSFDITDWGSGSMWWQHLKFGITIEAVVLRIMSKTDSFALKNSELWVVALNHQQHL